MQNKDIYSINLLAIVSIVAIIGIVILTSHNPVKITESISTETYVGKSFITLPTTTYLAPEPSPDYRTYVDSSRYQPLVPPQGGNPLTSEDEWTSCSAAHYGETPEQACQRISAGQSHCVDQCTTSRGYENWGAEAWSNTALCASGNTGTGQLHCNQPITLGPWDDRWKFCCSPPIEESCVPLNQSNLPNGNLILNNGCYRLAEDISFGYIISVQYEAELHGEGHTITGNNQNVLIDIRNSAVVTNLKARNANTGFLLRDTAQCTDCEALYNTGNGFTLYDSAILTRANAHHNSATGIELGQNSQAIESKSNNQIGGTGFFIQDDAYVYKGTASHNQEFGFALTGNGSRVRDSSADHNRVGFIIGFYPTDSPTMENSPSLSFADYNTDIGFLVQGKGKITTASRATNNPIGYSIVGSATDGVASVQSPSATASIGTNERGWGIIVQGNALVTGVKSNSNTKGVLVKTGATLNGGQVCSNTENSITVDGGRVTGGFGIGPQAISGCNTGDCSGYTQTDDCQYGGGGSPLIYKGSSPAFAKPYEWAPRQPR